MMQAGRNIPEERENLIERQLAWASQFVRTYVTSGLPPDSVLQLFSGGRGFRRTQYIAMQVTTIAIVL